LLLEFDVISKRQYTSKIWVHPFDVANENLTFNTILQKESKVYCNCKMFKYFLVYALRHRKAILASKEFGLALHVSAVEKNPENKAYLCKHLIACVRNIQKNLAG